MADDYRRPGWYPDPDGPGERWWNGSGWSDSRRGTTAAPTATDPQPVPASARPDPYATAAPASNQVSGTVARSIDMRANRNALIGFIAGLITLFVLNMGGPVAVVFSLLGIRRSRQLTAEGNPAGRSTLVFGLIGLVAGSIATVTFILWIVAIASSLATNDYYP